MKILMELFKFLALNKNSTLKSCSLASLLFISGSTYAHVKVLLTFDDGPSNALENPSRSILKTLDEQNITAAFFVLTNTDSFQIKNFTLQEWKKGETELGFEIMQETASAGHVLGVHWGGRFKSQLDHHTSRLALPPYDFNNDGVLDKVTKTGNALESDLLECINRIQEVYGSIGLKNEPINYLRPPVWVYKDGQKDARPTYKALGLKMILTDAFLSDGGFGFQFYETMLKDMQKAIKSGEDKIVVTMHDNQARTAKNLPRLIERIRESMSELDLIEGLDWSFTQSKTQVRTLLDSKKKFLLKNNND